MGLDVMQRLRLWAEDDLRGIAQDAPIMGLKIEPNELRMWAALMDEGADEIERLRKMVAHAAGQGVTFPPECLPAVEACVVVIDPDTGVQSLVYDPDLQKSETH
jgi:hypothetical protein